jgi:hypothetical protein
MMMTDDRASGADDVAGTLYAGEGLRKLRFLMTDNSQTGRARREHPRYRIVNKYTVPQCRCSFRRLQNSVSQIAFCLSEWE